MAWQPHPRPMHRNLVRRTTVLRFLHLLRSD
jgi:hypothetical protein